MACLDKLKCFVLENGTLSSFNLINDVKVRLMI